MEKDMIMKTDYSFTQTKTWIHRCCSWWGNVIEESKSRISGRGGGHMAPPGSYRAHFFFILLSIPFRLPKLTKWYRGGHFSNHSTTYVKLSTGKLDMQLEITSILKSSNWFIDTDDSNKQVNMPSKIHFWAFECCTIY